MNCFYSQRGFPGGSEVKASAWNVGDLGSIPGWGRFPGEGNGNPLQYSCLENPMDGGAWWATVHRVARSQKRLSNFTSLQVRIPRLKSKFLPIFLSFVYSDFMRKLLSAAEFEIEYFWFSNSVMLSKEKVNKGRCDMFLENSWIIITFFFQCFHCLFSY